jgi:hypothetical protein
MKEQIFNGVVYGLFAFIVLVLTAQIAFVFIYGV